MGREGNRDRTRGNGKGPLRGRSMAQSDCRDTNGFMVVVAAKEERREPAEASEAKRLC